MKLTSKCLAVALSALFAATPAVPAAAMPLPAVTVQPVEAGNAVQLVDHRRHWRHRHWGPYERRRYYRHRHHRHHSNAWVPFAILGMGAMIGGAIANDRGYGGSHVRWCANRYRSYRAYDNTFQPYNGPRRQCHSPYR